MAERTHDDILAKMTEDIDLMFQQMGSAQGKQELNRYSMLVQFGGEFGECQAHFAENQRGRRPDAPPPVDREWAPPQSVKQANQQFQRFTKYAQARDEDIDSSSQKLAEVNTRLVKGLEQIFAPPA
jgi:hypothetical protein